MNPATKVVINTGIVYIKLFLSIIIGLITTRLVLVALGQTDFGIFSLVGGITGMLAFLNTSMSQASVRFIAHSLGVGDNELIKKTISTTIVIHLILGFVLLFIMETGGYFMFKYWLNIPDESLYDAKMVFHFMVISTFVAVLSVPYEGLITSHENFFALSLIEILGLIINLVIALYISFIENNQLITYGFLILLNQVVLRIIKQVYSIYKYKESKIRFLNYVDKDLMKKIILFSGWNLLSTAGAIFMVQSKSVLINMFFGVSLNASNGVTKSLAEKLNGVVIGMTNAINPQIIKNEGAGDRNKMLMLTFAAAKFSTFLFGIVAIPVFIEANFLFVLWLKNVPEYVIIFTRLVIISMVIEKLTFSITRAIKAIGDIKQLSIAETISMISTIPITYFLYKNGMPPQAIFLVGIVNSTALMMIRLYYGKRVANLNISEYLIKIIAKAIIPLFLSTIISSIPYFLLSESLLRLAITTVTSLTTTAILIRYMGLTNMEFEKLKSISVDILYKLKRR